MALTATLAWVDSNSLVYRIVNAATLGTTVTITASGAATPDLVTDGASTAFGKPVSAALRRVVRAGLDGIGSVAAGALTQANARALLLEDGLIGTSSGVTTPNARMSLVNRATAGNDQMQVDANVDGSGRPTIVITCAAVACTYYLHVDLNHSLAH